MRVLLMLVLGVIGGASSVLASRTYIADDSRELYSAIAAIKQTCSIISTPKFPEGPPSPTEREWKKAEKFLGITVHSHLKLMYQELTPYNTRGISISRLIEEVNGPFYRDNIDAHTRGLGQDWVVFCIDNGRYYAHHSFNGIVRWWSPLGDNEYFSGKDRYASLAHWVTEVLLVTHQD